MARTPILLTSVYQEIATTAMVLTVDVGFGELLSVNDVDSDAAAHREVASDKTQVLQNEAKSTWAKGDGITVIVDAA